MSIIKRKAGSEDIVKSVLEFDAVPTEGSPNLVESGAVAQAIGNLGQPLQWKGPATVAQLNAGITGIQPGWTYTLTDAGTLDGNIEVEAGDEVAWTEDEEWFQVGPSLAEVKSNLVQAQSDISDIQDVIPDDAADTNKLVTQTDLDNAQDSWQSGFTPKGEADVDTINALATQSNGDQYILTDSGTLTDGSLAVSAGETVAWNATDSVWYKVNQYALESEFDYCKDKINGKDSIYEYDLSGASTGYYYKNNGQLQADAESKYLEITFDGEANGKELTISVGTSTQSGDGRYYVVEDENGVVKYYIKNGTIATDHNYKVNVGKVYTGWKLKASWKTVNGNPAITYVVQHISSIEEDVESKFVRYVATNGNDGNDGTAQNPFKSVSAACNSGAETVIVAGGIYDDNLLDLSESIHDKITIKGARGESVIFKKSQSLILADGSEELVSGYTKVYSAHLESAPAITGTRGWLFFDGLDYARTEIQASEIHPLERGKFYRCDCTRITKTTANTLSDALAEIEAETTNYKWWYDSDTKTLYFNRADSTETYPIYNGGNNSNYLKTRTDQSIVLSNIEFRYGCVNLKFLNIAELYNVASKYVNASGAFIYDNSIAVTFDHCEAASCYYSENGDGFNGHATAGVNPGSKYCQATLRHCWAHDNNDDGYSDHEYAEATIEGGLFEYNNKGGVTPSYGSHCVCRDVLSRKNYNGFYYTGTASEGNAGQMICFNCLSENNFRGNAENTGGYKVDGENNYIKLVGCRSIGDTHCVVGWTASATVELIDFGYKNPVGSVTAGPATLVNNNTTIYT